jgi:hypothetical protein
MPPITTNERSDAMIEFDEAYVKSEEALAKQRAMEIIVDFLDGYKRDAIDGGSLRVEDTTLNESEKDGISVVISAIDLLRDDLLVWARKE